VQFLVRHAGDGKDFQQSLDESALVARIRENGAVGVL
jgi:hypothetical protein